MFTIFMVSMLIFSFGFVIYRMPLLRAQRAGLWLSREAAFLFNNWILLFCAGFVLFATMFPTLSEAVTGERITVGPPFFNQWMIPIGLAMLVLTGIGPLLAWRKSTLINLRDQFVFPILCGLLVGGTTVALGVRIWSSGLCFAFSGFVIGTITQEFWRGARVRQHTTGTDLLTALIGLVGRNKRRYGGYIIHVAIVLLFLGFAGSGFKLEESALLTPGQEAQIGSCVIRHNSLSVTDDGRKQMITADMTVLRDGVELTKMCPARWFSGNTRTNPRPRSRFDAVRGGPVHRDAAVRCQPAIGERRITVNPLVNWVWLGFGLLAFGTPVALLPETAFAFAVGRVPDARRRRQPPPAAGDRVASRGAGAGWCTGPHEQDRDAA